jgi:hypothetical protein
VNGFFDCSDNPYLDNLEAFEGAPLSVSEKFVVLPSSSDDGFVCLSSFSPPINFDKLREYSVQITKEKAVFFSNLYCYLEILKYIKKGENIPNPLITPGLLALLKEKNPEVYKKVKELTDEESTKIKDILGDFGFD